MKSSLIAWIGLLASALAAEVPAGTAKDPGFYVRKATWQQTMLASRDALAAAEQARLATLRDPVGKDVPGFQPYASGEQKVGQRGLRQAKVRVRDLDVVWLVTSPAGGAGAKLAGCWGEPTLVARDGTRTPLVSLKPEVSRGSVEVGSADAPAAGGKRRAKPLRVDRRELATALVVGPGTELCYRLDGKYETLEALVAMVSGPKGAGMEFFVSRLPASETLARETDRAAIWKLVERDFAGGQAVREIAQERAARIWDRDWAPGDLRQLAQRYAGQVRSATLAAQAKSLASAAKTPADVQALAALFHQAQDAAALLAQAQRVSVGALRLAIEDLSSTFGEKYPRGKDFLARLAALEKAGPAALAEPDKAAELVALQREALLANPLLAFDRLLVIRRGNSSPKMGLPQNWQGNCAVPRAGFDDEIAVLSPVRPDGTLTTLFKPKRGAEVADVDLAFAGDRILFSSLGDNGKWQIFEIRADGSGPRQVTRGPIADVDNYDPCYLPSGKILFASTAVMEGVPCVGGSNAVANLFVMDADGGSVRQLCFDQDHNWCPTVMNDGRVMFSRWEYGDTPHYFTRLLFHMNPDGTQQMALSGSNSYWPNSIFYARPIPGDASKVVAVISGHHGVARMGELVVLDTARGRHEADGALQRIPGHGQEVKALIADGLVNGSWPKFLHPWPLSDKYFLVSMMDKGSSWGIWLVDVFDNALPLCELPGSGLFEPVPLAPRPSPPAIPDKVDPARKDAVVYMTDVYRGGGLEGVPRGMVKKLRLFEWHYCYQRIGGHQCVGVESGWDVKRILGTVPVEADGSALFDLPANVPVSVQPLDGQGRALQLMRSWFVGMPGEVLSCVGCHESQSAGTPNHHTLASQRPPSAIAPWHGPARGFSFPREVQPVLDAHCVRCHDGKPREDKQAIPSFAEAERGWSGFDKAYLALHPYVRRPGPESDYHMLPPAEYYANTSELVQMLEKGHHGVQLDPEAWDRLVTWIDLNVPDHGTWTEQAGEPRTAEQRALRIKYRTLFAGVSEDPEAIYPTSYKLPDVAKAASALDPRPSTLAPPSCPGWPFDGAEARKRQAAAGPVAARTLDLGSGVKLDLVLIPAGEFVMGDPGGDADEQPLARVRIERPFWMGRVEVTNQQFRAFDPQHDSRFIDQHWKDHALPGYPANGPSQPAIRLSWRQAVAFCRWLGEKTGEGVALPTEAQWEWACRAGTATPLWCGGLDADFSKAANLADASLDRMAVKGVNPKPIPNPSPYEAYLPSDRRFNDGEMIVADVGKYQPNPWGLLDMHGNVAEWTLTAWRPYPYVEGDGRNQPKEDGEKVVRGGSWLDRPKRARSAFRLHYPGWQGVFDVGFRIVCPATGPLAEATE